MASVWTDQTAICSVILDQDWKQIIQTVIRIERRYQRYNTRKKEYVECIDGAWYVSNRTLNAEHAYEYVLKHWGIENTNNYVRDVTLKEDYSRIRIKPGNMAVIRSTALNIIRHSKATNVSEELFLNALNWTRVYNYPHFI